MDLSCPKLKECISRGKIEHLKFNCVICRARHGKPMTTNSQEEVKTTETKMTTEQVMKKCSKESCGKPLLPATQVYFSKNMSTPDHLERWCKECKRKAGQDYRDDKRKKKEKLAGKKRSGGNGRKKPGRKIAVSPIPQPDQLATVRVTPEDLFKAVRLSHAEEACKIIVEKFAPGYEIILRLKVA